MKCRQAAREMEKYLKGDLSEQQVEIFKKHVDCCNDCKEEMWIKNEVSRLSTFDRGVKLPDNFTDNVMQEVLKLNMYPAKGSPVTSKNDYVPIFRRLGISMLITAAVMLLLTLNPLGVNYSNQYYESRARAVVSENIYHTVDVMGQINTGIQNFFNILNQSIDKFKEV